MYIDIAIFALGYFILCHPVCSAQIRNIFILNETKSSFFKMQQIIHTSAWTSDLITMMHELAKNVLSKKDE